jgi:hypothetical protein
VAEGTPGALDARSAEGAAGTARVVSGLPPMLGGSVVPGADAAPAVDGASSDARFSSFPAARGGLAGVAMDTGSGLGLVWLVFHFSLLRGSLPSFYSAEVLLPLTNLGKGLPQYGQGAGQLLSSVFGGLGLCRAVALVHRSWWRKADFLLWRPAPSTLIGPQHDLANK